MLRQAWIGSSTTSHAICLPGSTPGTHGRLLHAAECFWLEATGSELSVQGTPIPAGELLALSTGLTFTIGGTQLTVESAGQTGL